MPPPAGTLQQRINLQRVSAPPDSYGEPIPTWRTVQTLWAEVKPLDGRELWRAQQVAAEATHRVTLRYYSKPLTAKMRVLWGSRVFGIESVINDTEGNHEHVLLCKEQQADVSIFLLPGPYYFLLPGGTSHLLLPA